MTARLSHHNVDGVPKSMKMDDIGSANYLAESVPGRLCRGATVPDRQMAPILQAPPMSTRPIARHARPASTFAGFNGTLQVDGYGAYAELAEGGKIELAFCWSHVRRRFNEIQVATPAPIASKALVRIAALYAVESDIRGASADERRRVQQLAKPIIDTLRPWLEGKLAVVSGKSTIAGDGAQANGRFEITAELPSPNAKGSSGDPIAE
jgi:hypothetical protein